MDASPDLLAGGAAVMAAVLVVVVALARRRRQVTGSLGRLLDPEPARPGSGVDGFGRAASLALGRLHPVGTAALAVVEVDPTPLGAEPTSGTSQPTGRPVLAAVERMLGSVVEGGGAVHSDGVRFLILLPDMTEPEASRVAEAVRESIERALIAGPVPGRPVTVSVGLAVVRGEPGRALQLADAALYEAQAGGGNRVAVAEVPAEVRGGPAAEGPTDPPAWLRGAQA